MQTKTMWRLFRRNTVASDEHLHSPEVVSLDHERMRLVWNIWKELWRDEEIIMY